MTEGRSTAASRIPAKCARCALTTLPRDKTRGITIRPLAPIFFAWAWAAGAHACSDEVVAAIKALENKYIGGGPLPEAYRETLVLRLCEGLDGPEIAARTGLTHGSVRVNLTRGMALLRPLLAARGLP